MYERDRLIKIELKLKKKKMSLMKVREQAERVGVDIGMLGVHILELERELAHLMDMMVIRLFQQHAAGTAPQAATFE